MTSRATLLLVCTLLGFAAASAATWVHATLVRHPDLSSVCDVSATVNCTEAYSSSYGKLGGVPVAVLGVLFFGGLLVLQLGSLVLRVPDPAHVGPYVFLLSLPGVAFAAYLAIASWFVLGVVCLLCVAIDLATLGVCVIGALMTRFPFASLPGRLAGDLKSLRARPAAAVLGLGFVAAAVALLALFPRAAAEPVFASEGETPRFVAPPPAEEALPQASQVSDYMNTATRRMIPVDAAGAVVVVVKFNDYQCPPCGSTFQAYKPLKAKWDKEAPGKVKFVTKDFPLEGECNAAIPQGPHPIACEAAAAVRMARKQGKAEALEDWLFANQATLTPDGLKRAVRDIGGVADFDAQYPKILGDVRTDTSLGGFLGVRSTPTFFVNGIQMPDNRVPIMDLAIEHELRRAGVKVNLPRPRADFLAVMPAIETHALAKDYKVGFWRPRPYRALDGLTLSVEPGEVFGFLGPNGAGKTTTLKLLMQLVYPTSGTASILGRPLGDLEMKRRIGFLPENPYFYDYLTAEELLTYFAGLFGYKGADRAKRVGRLLDEVGLGAERRLQLRKFSKGMIQRVGLAQTLINDPDVIFLDEPMSGLDPLGRRDVRALILRLRDDGRTVFFSSHILSDAESLCSRIAIAAKGRLMASGTLADLVTAQLTGWEITLEGLPQPPPAEHAGIRGVTVIAAGRYAVDALPTADPLRLVRELTVDGGRLVSVVQVHDTLEDLFVRQVDQASGTDRFAPPPAAAAGGAR